MSVVENMVCPKCARMHGTAHAAGCPSDLVDPPEAYVAGWDMAHGAFGTLAQWAAEDERKRVANALRTFVEQIDMGRV